MAQSSDSNNSNNNNGEIGSTDAEQILDSIIGHIEAKEDTVGRDVSNATKPSRVEQAPEQAASPQSDFSEIEKRAAQLASMLGGAGLSYNAGAEKPLSNSNTEEDKARENVKAETPVSHRSEDPHVETPVSDIAFVAAQDPEAAKSKGIAEQQQHVTQWEADARQDQVRPKPLPARKPAIRYDSDVVEFNRDEAVAPGRTVAPASPDLNNIEKQIEALSSSMRDKDVVHHEPNGADPHEIDERVSSMETQIVQLLDKVTLVDQNLEEVVVDVVRNEVHQAVQGAIASSDLIETLKTEIKAGGEERRLQDVHMSDSLDALHDALKDMDERISVVESAKPDVQVAADNLTGAAGAGIASSVVETRLNNFEAEQNPVQPEHVQEQILAQENSRPAAAPVAAVTPPEAVTSTVTDTLPVAELRQEDELPTWLEDATQDLYSEEKNVVEKPADIFATKPDAKAPTRQQAQVIEPPAARVENPEVSEPVYAGEAADVLPQAPEPRVVAASVPAIDVPVEPPQQSDDEWDRVYEPKAEPEPAKDEGRGFLQAARAAARAANNDVDEPVPENQLSEEKQYSEEQHSGPRNTNFLAAAKQKQLGEEVLPGEPLPAQKAKNSLFSSRVEGPNSLLVFTSLVLFGTSALLLYGMGRNKANTGSVVQLNALEKVAGQKANPPSGLAGRENSGKINEYGNTAKTGSSKSSNGLKNTNDKRSHLDDGNSGSEFKTAFFDGGKGTNSGDTLTDYDKLVSSRMSDLSPIPSPIEFTGALGDRAAGKRAGSLFEEYISFSGLSNNGTKNAKSVSGLTESQKTDAKYNNGSDGLLASASSGDARAQYEVARRFGTGNGVQKSPTISVEWYEKSARAGYAPAIYRLATMYERGNGVTKDYQRAMVLYISAAEKGNVKAMHNLAVLYTGGNLGKADYVSAVKWYTKAADFGVKDSQFNLGIIYQNGMDGKKNLVEAYKWYMLASRSGDLEAKDLMVGLREELTAEQLKTLDQGLKVWKAKIPDRTSNAMKQLSKGNTNSKVAGALPF